MRSNHSDNPELNALLDRIASIHLPGIDLSLGRTQALLRALGNPHRKLPPVIHVAGTNGKGSLIAYLRAIFERAGYRVHQYTSPYLVRFNEQIIVAGEEIKDDHLIDIIKTMMPKLNGNPVTFFEAMTIAAFMAFAQRKADVVLLETGLGGRLDATNVIEKPALCAITPVSIDHEEFLGKGLARIAGEKAGIMKRGAPCVISRQEAASGKIIERSSKIKGVPLHRFGKEWSVVEHAGGFTYISNRITLDLPLPNLAGPHQVYNAANAVACIDVLKQFMLDEDDIIYGVTHAHWPARLQRLGKGALQKHLPGRAELWLDGGHNEDAARMLAGWAGAAKNTPLFVICGMLKNKDSSAFLQHIAPHCKALATVAIPGESASRPANEMAQLARAKKIDAFAAPDVEAAIQELVRRASSIGKTYRILICGSLYLAGHILRNNN